MVKNNRPFEVGDLILAKVRIGMAIWLRVEFVGERTVHATANMQNDMPKKFYFADDDFCLIKTIRKPRKGNAESRAIVAMLAKRFLMERRYEWSIEKRDRFWKSETQILCDAYQDAKDILK